MLAPLPALAAVLSVLVAASDLYARRVPNRWLLAALAVGACLAASDWLAGRTGAPWPQLLGLLAGFAALLPFHLIGWMGAGDVKFFATLGFLLGAPALLPIGIAGSLLGGVHALASPLARRWCTLALPGWTLVQAWPAPPAADASPAARRRARPGLPYAAYLAAGALLVVFVPGLAQGGTP